MKSLKSMLLKEERRLETILEKAKEMKKDAPPGSLRISGNKK